MIVNIQSDKPNYHYQFSVSDSGIIGVYGISGSGKTSLLRAIAGFGDQIKGSIKTDNNTVLDSAHKITLKVQKCSYMSQNPILFPHWTVQENLDFAEAHSVESKKDTTDLIHGLNCSGLLNKYPSQLSGGEKQRIAFIRTLICSRGSQLMLLDEPFSALDIEMRKTALNILHQYRNNNLIFLVTHDINELYHYANELLYIDNGSVLYQDSIEAAMASNQCHLPIASKVILDGKHQVIYADDISISLKRQTDSSIIHQIPVTITNIHSAKGLSILKLITHDKQQLIAKITKHSLDTLQLTLNQEVMANFKATSYSK